MNLGQFHSRVSSAIKRGSSLDTLIPLWVADAARILEQNYSFSWMERTTTHTILMPAAGQPLAKLSLALDPLTKAVDWVRQVVRVNDTDGYEWYGAPLVGVDGRQVRGISGGNPSGYWVDAENGTLTLRFDAIPQADFNFAMHWWKYTDWPVDDAATPMLLVRGQYALFCQTLIIFANEMKDPSMVGQYGGLLQGALNTLLRSEEDLKLSHQNDLKMNYSGLR